MNVIMLPQKNSNDAAEIKSPKASLKKKPSKPNKEHDQLKKKPNDDEQNVFTNNELEYVFHDHDYAMSSTISFATLNVCGLKSKLNTEEFVNECQSIDVMLLQETKTDSLDEAIIKKRLKEFGLAIHMKHRYQLARTRSGGVAVIYNEKYVDHIRFIDTNTPDCLWFKIVLSNGQTLLCCNVYVPPKGSRFFKNDIFEKIECDLIQFKIDLSPDEILIAGDFNARTNDVTDYVILDKFVAQENGFGDEILDELDIENKLDILNIPLKRLNRDKSQTNFAGKELINLCKDHGLLISNGRVGYDRFQGNFNN